MAQSLAYTAEMQAPRTRFRWVVLGLIFAIYTVASADRANIGIALPYIQKDFGLTNTQVGAIVSLFSLSYGIFQIPSAFLIRRYGVRTVLPVFMILTSVFTATIGAIGFFSAALGAASAAFLLQANRFALGLAEAPLANSLMTSINNWFPAQEKGQAAGVFISSAKFGPVIVPPLGALVILYFGWQHLFFACALPGILLPLLWYFFVPNDPAGSRFCSPAEQEYIAGRGPRTPVPALAPTAANQPGRAQAAGLSEPTLASPRQFGWLDRLIRARVVQPIDSAGELFRSWTAWGVALGYFFVQGIVSVILAWLPTYLKVVKNFSILNVGFVAAAPFVGAVTGNILGGWLSDRFFTSGASRRCFYPRLRPC